MLVTFADEVHAARGVAKKHTSAPDAFLSIATGPLGRMLEGRPQLHTRVTRRRALPVPERDHRPGPAADRRCSTTTPPWPRRSGALADGLVVAAFGAGHLRPPVADAVAALVAADPGRARPRAPGAGSVHTHTYGGPGSEVDLLGRGLVNAGHLDGLKSRLLLAVLLATGADRRHGSPAGASPSTAAPDRDTIAKPGDGCARVRGARDACATLRHDGTMQRPEGRPQVVAHRGSSESKAEHTLGAYVAALEEGADALECDVRLTADGHLVCVHDRKVDRTTNARGLVSTMTPPRSSTSSTPRRGRTRGPTSTTRPRSPTGTTARCSRCAG